MEADFFTKLGRGDGALAGFGIVEVDTGEEVWELGKTIGVPWGLGKVDEATVLLGAIPEIVKGGGTLAGLGRVDEADGRLDCPELGKGDGTIVGEDDKTTDDLDKGDFTIDWLGNGDWTVVLVSFCWTGASDEAGPLVCVGFVSECSASCVGEGVGKESSIGFDVDSSTGKGCGDIRCTGPSLLSAR